MNELNHTVLKNTLKNLPTYAPDDSIWNAIESRLPLMELPAYEPPVDIWESIENQLVIEEKQEKEPFQLRGVRLWKFAAVAASLAIVLTASFYWFLNKKENAQIIVSTETIDNQLIKPDWNDADKDFEIVQEFCKSALPKCEEPEFKNLKSELDELNTAREELKNALSDYNSDPDLVAQLSQLENERSVVLRKMIQQM
jgi:hypothetical protein